MNEKQDNEHFEELATALSNGLNHHVLYSAEHPAVGEACRTAAHVLHRIFLQRPDDALFLQVTESRVMHEGRFLVGATIRSRRLIEFVRSLTAGGLVFQRGVEPEELARLFELSDGIGGPPRELAAGQARLQGLGVARIGLAGTEEHMAWYGNQNLSPVKREMELHAIDLLRAVPVYQSMFDAVEESMSAAAAGESVDVAEARTVGEQLEIVARDGFSDLFELATYPDYDTYTVGHSIRVALYGVCVGTHIGAPPEVLIELGAAGLLHDVGKAKVPYEILYKPGRLTDEEFTVIRTHAPLGARILLESEEVSRFAIGAAWGHHLRFDGAGYPPRRDWAYSSKVTSLLQVCDVFEALTAARPYKPALTARQAYEIMLKDRAAFDPAAFTAFVRAVGIYPPGCYVGLSDGTAARVLAPTERLDRPRLQRLGEEDMLDLSEPGAGYLSVQDELTEAQARELAERGAAEAQEEVAVANESDDEEPPELDLPEWPVCGR